MPLCMPSFLPHDLCHGRSSSGWLPTPGPEAMELSGDLGSHPDQHPPPETVDQLLSVLFRLQLQRKLCAVRTGSKGQTLLELPGHGGLCLICFMERPHLKLISHSGEPCPGKVTPGSLQEPS